jgi:hypothetical protein
MGIGTRLGSIDGKESDGIDDIERGQGHLEGIAIDDLGDLGFVCLEGGDTDLQGDGDVLKVGFVGLEEELTRVHDISFGLCGGKPPRPMSRLGDAESGRRGDTGIQ